MTDRVLEGGTTTRVLEGGTTVRILEGDPPPTTFPEKGYIKPEADRISGTPVPRKGYIRAEADRISGGAPPVVRELFDTAINLSGMI